LRFKFEEHENITFSPSEGHIVPKGSKNIIATFTSAETVAFQNVPVGVTYNKIIQYNDKGKKDPSEPIDWDCEMKTVTYLTDKEFAKEFPKGVNKKTGEKASKQVKRMVPQPFCADGKDEEGAVLEEKIVPLKCTAVVDTVKYECETKTIAFKQTPMFQTRVFSFPIKNVGKAKLDFAWDFEAVGDSRPSTAKSAQPVPCPYQISPQQGSVPAGETTTFTVRFSTLEVEDFIYKLVCKMPGLAADGTPLVCLVRGQSERPVCHFELESSTYLQRRPADMVGPNGQLGALDPNVHVVEMVSLGTRVRNTKRFHVINPQNASYDFTFELEGVPNPAFRCISPGGITCSRASAPRWCSSSLPTR
jgi:hydrocephalus-inducing protein